MPQHTLSFVCRRIPTSRRYRDIGKIKAPLLEQNSKLLEGFKEVSSYIVVQGFERRHVEDPQPSCRIDSQDELIDRPEEGSESLAASRWSGYKNVGTPCNKRPAFFLHLRRLAQHTGEPHANEWMKQIKI